MEVIKIDESAAEKLAPLVADFRVTLRSYKGVSSEPDVEAGKNEILEFLRSGYPIFAVTDGNTLAGYIVCRIEGTCLWVEHLFVRSDFRRKGAASLLFETAEKIAASMGEDTMFNYVHPNNDGMIQFLRSKGYTVLNLIEIRKPYKNEGLTRTIKVNDNSFDY